MKSFSTRLFLFLLGIGAILTVAMTVAAFGMIKTSIIKPIPEISAGSIILPTPTPDPLKPVSVLLMGYGGPNHDGGYLTDSMMVIRIDPKTKQVAFISIPRDLYVELPITTPPFPSKINAAFAIGLDDRGYPNKPIQYRGKAGAGNLAKQVVGATLGFQIDYFAAVGFDGFTKAIDVLGGVDITIPQTFTDPYYPIEGKEKDTCGRSEEEIKIVAATMSGELLDQSYSCRYEILTFTKGDIHLDGINALKYARSRHSSVGGTDFGRSRRQQLLLTAVKDKVLSISFLPKLLPFISSITDNFMTDIDIATIQKFIDLWGNPKDYRISAIALTNENVLRDDTATGGAYILSPTNGKFKWNELQNFIATQAGVGL